MGPEPTALLAIIGLILIKEAGVPVPVPGDLIVIGAGVAAGRGDLDPLVALVAIVLASIVGGVVQYGLLRSVARPALLRLLGRVGSAERSIARPSACAGAVRGPWPSPGRRPAYGFPPSRQAPWRESPRSPSWLGSPSGMRCSSALTSGSATWSASPSSPRSAARSAR